MSLSRLSIDLRASRAYGVSCKLCFSSRFAQVLVAVSGDSRSSVRPDGMFLALFGSGGKSGWVLIYARCVSCATWMVGWNSLMTCSLRRYGLPRLSHFELNCGSGSGRVPRSAQVVVVDRWVESGWFSGMVSVV